jgi:YHS domain-containing protein
LVFGCAAAPPAARLASYSSEERYLVNRDKDGLAIQGYDPVAYFTDNRPVKGDAKYRSPHEGATYQFASADHKKMFDAAPAKYAPQFGGYCGYAASINKVSPISPEFFQVLDGRLVLQHNQRAWDLWNKDVPGNLKKADANWPGLAARNATPAKRLVNIDKQGVALQGYDPIAYFKENKPVKGSAEFQAVYDGAVYHFATKENKDQFELDPAQHAPQFGGYCGYAASINKVSPINVNYFQIMDGRLVLQHTQKAYDLFNKDAPGNLKKADGNWPGLVERHGR